MAMFHWEEFLIALLLILIISALILFKIKKNKKTILLFEEQLNQCIQENNILISKVLELDQTNRELNKITRLVWQSPNAIMIMDKDGNILSINQGFTNMYEYTYKEFISKLGNNYRRTSFSLAVNERIERITKTKQPVKYEALNITKSGKELWTQTALVPLLNEKGEFDGMVTIDTDIHQRIVTSDNLILRMEEINSKIDNMSAQFKILVSETKSLFERISESNLLIEQTDQIIKFIKEVSDKTKILGINASIEASLAGQHGKGFRVVANEIVEISNKTIQSVTQIGAIINSVKNKQLELSMEKDGSEAAIADHQKLIKKLKQEIKEVEDTITQLKELA